MFDHLTAGEKSAERTKLLSGWGWGIDTSLHPTPILTVALSSLLPNNDNNRLGLAWKLNLTAMHFIGCLNRQHDPDFSAKKRCFNMETKKLR